MGLGLQVGLVFWVWSAGEGLRTRGGGSGLGTIAGIWGRGGTW